MLLRSLDGKEHKINLSKYLNEPEKKSKLHVLVRTFLREVFPNEVILEEVFIPNDKLYLDFFLPHQMLCVEAHGEQHYKFIIHFHSNKINYLQSLKRDRKKSSFCEYNNIDLVVLNYNESNDEWRDKLSKR